MDASASGVTRCSPGRLVGISDDGRVVAEDSIGEGGGAKGSICGTLWGGLCREESGSALCGTHSGRRCGRCVPKECRIRWRTTLSPDLKQVLSLGPHGGWFVYLVDRGSAQEVHGIGPNEAVTGWRQDSRSLYVSPRGEGTDSIPVSILEIAGGKRSEWKTIHPSQAVFEIHDVHVTPDGQAYAYNYVTAQSDLHVAHGLN